MQNTYAEVQNRYRSEGHKTYAIPVGASDEVGLWGYIDCASELREDFLNVGIEPGAVVTTVGSGGTLGGLILGQALHDLNTEIFGFNVCDNEAYFLDKIATDFDLWATRYQSRLNVKNLPITVIDGYVGPGYAKAAPEVFLTIS